MVIIQLTQIFQCAKPTDKYDKTNDKNRMKFLLQMHVRWTEQSCYNQAHAKQWLF